MLGVLGFLGKEPLFSRVTLPSVGSPENCPGTGCNLGLIFRPLTNASSSWLSTNKGAMETISIYSSHPFSISSATCEHQLLLWPWNLGDETLRLGPLPAWATLSGLRCIWDTWFSFSSAVSPRNLCPCCSLYLEQISPLSLWQLTFYSSFTSLLKHPFFQEAFLDPSVRVKLPITHFPFGAHTLLAIIFKFA